MIDIIENEDGTACLTATMADMQKIIAATMHIQGYNLAPLYDKLEPNSPLFPDTAICSLMQTVEDVDIVDGKIKTYFAFKEEK